MKLVEGWINCWRYIVNIKGKTSRVDYWNFVILNTLIILALFQVYKKYEIIGNFSGSYVVASFFAQLSATLRRFRDAGRSRWNILWNILPFGVFYVLFLLLLPSHQLK
jgi:uncharacterized membrane protein YhaH (DUF805 family)